MALSSTFAPVEDVDGNVLTVLLSEVWEITENKSANRHLHEVLAIVASGSSTCDLPNVEDIFNQQ